MSPQVSEKERSLSFSDVVQQWFCVILIVSYLISFPLVRGEGEDGGGHSGPLPPT
jgi:hypothetical protein